ncbi:hypothetical protein QJ527_10095 [Enterococcus mundtii]|uniref:hypothetical protein n=1 Tax=Enterococcus TaxID=1350 RepID=UPI0004508020|nr:hypothetical protein [Enterococcus mundtii]EYT95707.1 hypothetical protein AK89_07245 [Enterococcus mundtii CRL35]MDA9429723.1 hypothetical protein [Enterococcus mundtii 1A]MDK4211884.1 hypothetical protein [Enterococcus mundtii]MDO7879520.1 hypothetical protein [Enterococcus mundtii]
MPKVSFHTTITASETQIQLEKEQIQLSICSKPVKEIENSFYLYYLDKKCLAIGTKIRPKSFDQVITIHLPWDLEADYFMYLMNNQAAEVGLALEKDKDFKEKIPVEATKKLDPTIEKVTTVLSSFGYGFAPLTATKKKPAKARHRWTKQISEIPFTVEFRGSKATLYWISRNEMLIKAGATLLLDAPLNKDGSVSYAAKYGDKMRADYQEQIKDGKVVEDIIVKSVNEASLLLYYGGTNSWLELKDAQGKTLDEWSKVE